MFAGYVALSNFLSIGKGWLPRRRVKLSLLNTNSARCKESPGHWTVTGRKSRTCSFAVPVFRLVHVFPTGRRAPGTLLIWDTRRNASIIAREIAANFLIYDWPKVFVPSIFFFLFDKTSKYKKRLILLILNWIQVRTSCVFFVISFKNYFSWNVRKFVLFFFF